MRRTVMLIVTMAVVVLALPAPSAQAQDVVQVKEGCGRVLKVLGNTVIVRVDETRQTKVFRNIGPEVHFVIDGQKKSVYDLREGMNVCAYRLEQAPPPVIVTIEEREIETVVDEPDEYDAPKPAPPARPAPAPAPALVTLPSTGSQLPLAGLAGLILLTLAGGIGILRRMR